MNYHGNSLKIFAELCNCGNSLTFLDILGNNSDPKLIMRGGSICVALAPGGILLWTDHLQHHLLTVCTPALLHDDWLY